MSRKKAERPGIVMYFDALPTLRKLSVEGQARFLMACLDYGATGEMTDLADLPLETRIRLETLLEQTLPRIDADGEKWNRNVLQKKYAVYNREAKKKGEDPISYDAYIDWAERASELDLIGSPL